MPEPPCTDVPSITELDSNSITGAAGEFAADAHSEFEADETLPPSSLAMVLPEAPTEGELASLETPAGALRLPAFRHRNFRLFWAGNLVSLVGTLAQQTAQGWLMRTLTSDPRQIALVAACGTIPIALLTLFAGVVADRVDKRVTLIITNAVAALLALALAALVAFGVIQMWQVALITLGVGVVNAFDIPVRQSFNVEMVGHEDLPNAIALNSAAFNGARVAGPAVGGLLLRLVGMAGCFVVNAISFIALIVGLSMMRLPKVVNTRKAAGFDDIVEGFRFVKGHPVLRLLMLLVAVVSIMGFSFGTLMSVFAKDVFHTDERGFATLMSFNGLGALGAAVVMAANSDVTHKGKRLLLGSFLFCWSVVAFALSPNLTLACFFLVLAGWFLMAFLMTANTMVQTLAPNELRGRVFALYSMALIGTNPIGAALIGQLAHVFTTRIAVALCASLAALFTLGLTLQSPVLWKER